MPFFGERLRKELTQENERERAEFLKLPRWCSAALGTVFLIVGGLTSFVGLRMLLGGIWDLPAGLIVVALGIGVIYEGLALYWRSKPG